MDASFLSFVRSSVGRGEREVEVKGSDSFGGWAGEGRRRRRASKRKIKAPKEKKQLKKGREVREVGGGERAQVNHFGRNLFKCLLHVHLHQVGGYSVTLAGVEAAIRKRKSE